MSPRVWAELVQRGADASLAKAIRDGDDDVRFAAWACCTAAVRASPDALVRLLAHAGVYEFLVSGPPPDDAIEAKRIKHDFVRRRRGAVGGMDDAARRAVEAAGGRGAFSRAPGTASPEVALRLLSDACFFLCPVPRAPRPRHTRPPPRLCAMALGRSRGSVGPATPHAHDYRTQTIFTGRPVPSAALEIGGGALSADARPPTWSMAASVRVAEARILDLQPRGPACLISTSLTRRRAPWPPCSAYTVARHFFPIRPRAHRHAGDCCEVSTARLASSCGNTSIILEPRASGQKRGTV